MNQGRLNVARMVARFATGTYPVLRPPAKSLSAGVAFDNTPTTLPAVPMSVQPASGRDLLRLPEGRRTTETRVVYAAMALQAGGEGSPYEADQIAIAASDWFQDPSRSGTVTVEVQQVETWPGANGYSRAIAQVSDASTGE